MAKSRIRLGGNLRGAHFWAVIGRPAAPVFVSPQSLTLWARLVQLGRTISNWVRDGAQIVVGRQLVTADRSGVRMAETVCTIGATESLATG